MYLKSSKAFHLRESHLKGLGWGLEQDVFCSNDQIGVRKNKLRNYFTECSFDDLILNKIGQFNVIMFKLFQKFAVFSFILIFQAVLGSTQDSMIVNMKISNLSFTF